MKTILITLTLLNMQLTAWMEPFHKDSFKLTPAPETVAYEIIQSMQAASADDYIRLFPSRSDFHEMMDKNASFYGEHLTAAKLEFDEVYTNELLPAVKSSFQKIINEGQQRGIDWRKIRLVHVVVHEDAERTRTMPLNIIVESNSKRFTICIENAFVWNGQWKVTQFMKLV